VLDASLRRLVRDQWVRLHGTPRVTVLAGAARARALWTEWLAIAGLEGALYEGELEPTLRAAVTQAEADAERPTAVLARRDAIVAWRTGRDDRMAALLDEGLLIVDEAPRDPRSLDARSVAEATLFEALEATPATRGRFELNGALSVHFGSQAAEVDLLSRGDALAIEIDGYHHFTDAAAYRRDRRKDVLLQTQGLLVIRLLAEDVMRDVRDAVNVVCQGLAYRRGASR
jgi:hypothetical protein